MKLPKVSVFTSASRILTRNWKENCGGGIFY